MSRMVDYSPTATIIIKYPTERGRTTEMFGGVTAGCRSEKLKKNEVIRIGPIAASARSISWRRFKSLHIYLGERAYDDHWAQGGHPAFFRAKKLAS